MGFGQVASSLVCWAVSSLEWVVGRLLFVVFCVARSAKARGSITALWFWEKAPKISSLVVLLVAVALSILAIMGSFLESKYRGKEPSTVRSWLCFLLSVAQR